MYYAVLEGGKSGAAFLGSQGDIWDATVWIHFIFKQGVILKFQGDPNLLLLKMENILSWNKHKQKHFFLFSSKQKKVPKELLFVIIKIKKQ
jgi:hypothetical protein